MVHFVKGTINIILNVAFSQAEYLLSTVQYLDCIPYTEFSLIEQANIVLQLIGN